MVFSYRLILAFLSILMLNSCQEVEEDKVTKSDFGNSISYDHFLWENDHNDTLEKTFEYSFNKWAKESNSYVTLTFKNDSNERIKEDDKSFYFLVNDKPLKEGSFTLNPTDNEVDVIDVKLVFKDKLSRDLYGYITITDSNVDRVNDIDDINNATIYKWSASQQLIMNPLKNILLWIGGLLSILILVYLLLLRPLLYKRFGKGIITIQQPFYKNTNLRGAIELVFTNKKVSQSFFNRVLKGKKLYVVNSFFTTPIYFIPNTKGKVRIKTGGAYSLDPFTSNLEKGKTFKVTNTSTNDDITITYL